MPAQPRKRPLAAGEDDDLLVARLTVQGVEHAFDPVVVGIDQCVVEDDGRRAAVAGEQAGEGEAP